MSVAVPLGHTKAETERTIGAFGRYLTGVHAERKRIVRPIRGSRRESMMGLDIQEVPGSNMITVDVTGKLVKEDYEQMIVRLRDGTSGGQSHARFCIAL